MCKHEHWRTFEADVSLLNDLLHDREVHGSLVAELLAQPALQLPHVEPQRHRGRCHSVAIAPTLLGMYRRVASAIQVVGNGLLLQLLRPASD